MALGVAQAAAAAPASVEIVRDDWGVPHVRSDSEAAAFYGLGYAQAADRIDAILMGYLSVSGRLASALGPDYVEADVQAMRWRFLEEGRLAYRRLQTEDPTLARDVVAFVAGIDRYLSDHPEKKPSWDPRLEPALPLARMAAAAWALEHTTGWEIGGVADCARGAIKVAVAAEAPMRAIGVTQPYGSNEWALAPWRTADNVAIAVADPHGTLAGGATELHLASGKLRFTGYAFPGTPIPYIGHNADVGWGTTVGGPDVADCYAITVDPAQPDRYRFDQGWRQITRREVSIAVKGQAPVTRTIETVVVNGVTVPILARKDGKVYAAIGSLDGRAEGTTRQLYRLFKARDAKEWIAAFDPSEIFPVNLAGADTHGNIFYLRAGRVPVRPSGYDWTRPVPGNTSATAWRGVRKAAELVQLWNPPQGYILNTNTAPDAMIADSPMTADRYPADIFNAEPGRTNVRTERGLEMLPNTFAATRDHVLDMLYDDHWSGVAAWQKALSSAAAAEPAWARSLNVPQRRFLDLLLGFDGQAHIGSVEALAYFHWQQAIIDQARADGVDIFQLNSDGLAGAPLDAKAQAVLRAAVSRAVVDMTGRYGTIERPFGEVFRIGRGSVSHPIGACTRYIGVPPGGVTWDSVAMPPPPFRSGSCGLPDKTGKSFIQSGQSHPTLMVMRTPIESWSASPLGQSDDPKSPHFADQSVLYSERRLKPTYFNPGELEGHVESAVTLTWTGR